MVFSRRRGVCGSFLKKNSDCFLVFALFGCGDGFGGGQVLVGLQPALREEMETLGDTLNRPLLLSYNLRSARRWKLVMIKLAVIHTVLQPALREEMETL